MRPDASRAGVQGFTPAATERGPPKCGRDGARPLPLLACKLRDENVSRTPFR